MIRKPRFYEPTDSNILWCDTETFSETDIKTAGTVKYTDHAEMLLVGFKLGDRYEAVDIYHGETIPSWVKDHIKHGGLVGAHNALFDYLVLLPKLPFLRVHQMIDTQAIVAAHGLPLSLEKAGKALGLDEDKQKLKDGKRLVRLFCIPRKPTKTNPNTRLLPEDAPEDWAKFKDEYLRLDIESMIEIYNLLSPLSPSEQQVWIDTQKVNLAGIPIDLETAKLINDKLHSFVDEQASEFIRLTGIFPTQRQKVLDWVRENGCLIDNLQAATVQEALESDNTPQTVKDALVYRANTTHMSFKKYPTMLAAARSNGTVAGTLMYHVSHTGRYGGRLLQPQNLTRGSIDGVEAVERVKDGEFSVELIKSCVRSMIYCEEGFTIVDYSSIEARILQWLAGDEDALIIFRSGQDSYKWMASKIYGTPYDEVTDKERFCGKQAILGLGYQMSAKKFIEMVESYGETMSYEEAVLAVDTYRQTHKKVVQLWSNIQQGAAMAIQRPGVEIKINRLLSFRSEGRFLEMLLPSGRSLRYYRPRAEDSFGKKTISYMGVNEKSQYVRVKSYGGKLTENAVQAIARDILVSAINNLLERNHVVTTHIHDEIVVRGTHEVERISEIMCELPDWAYGMPLEAEGFNSPRYKKG